jgi:fructokinase
LTREHEQRSGGRVPALEIAARAAAGDAIAGQAMASYERRMAKALAGVINLLDPDVIVLGGGLSNISRLYQHVPRLWNAHIFSAGVEESTRTRLVPARHGDASGVRGAAWLWPFTTTQGTSHDRD